MTTPTALMKCAFVRGLNTELLRQGAVTFPSKQAADYAADFVANHSGMPDPFSAGPELSLKIAADLCVMLTKAAHELCTQQGGYSAGLSKSASVCDPATVASDDALALMHKVAEESGNSLESAAQNNDGAALDLMQRPPGYAVVGVGNIERPGVGITGSEQPANLASRVDGDNSATATSKQAGIAALRKAAGAPYTSPDNTLANAAKVDDGAALDMANRGGPGYALAGVGNTDLTATGSGVQGKEKDVAPAGSPSGSNSVNAPKTASERKLNKLAARVVPFLPANLPDAVKVAHIRAMSGLGAQGQARYLEQVYSGLRLEKSASVQSASNFFQLAKKAEDEDMDGDDDVAEALEGAAAEIEGKKEKSEGDEKDEGSKEASARLAAATARVSGIRVG